MQPITNSVAALEPVARHAMPGSRDGSYSAPTLRFSSDGSSVIILQEVRGAGPVGWLRWYTPELSLGLLAVCVLVGVWVIVRTWRRPQRRDQYHCRRCNYDLTGPGGMPPDGLAKCPECGVDLARRPARLGRTGLSRAGLPVAACTLGVGLAVLGLAVSLRPAAAGMWGAAWMPRVTGVLGVLGAVGVRGLVHSGFCEGAREIEARAWQFRQDVWARRSIGDAVDAGSTGDGRAVVYTASTRPGWGGEVRVRWLGSGVDAGVSLKTASTTMPQGFAPSAERTKVYVAASVYSMSGPGGYGVQFYEVDVEAMTSRLVGEAPVRASGVPGQWSQAAPAMREVDGTLVWAVVRSRTVNGASETDVVTTGGRVFPLPGFKGNGMPGVISRDGKSLEVSTWTGAVMSVMQMSLVDGVIGPAAVTAPSGWASEVAGNGLRVCVVPVAAVGASQLQVVGAGGTVVALLSTGALAPGGPLAVSDDGRWAAASCTRVETDWLGQMSMESEILVWDLSPLDGTP